MAGENKFGDSLNALFKTKYADKLANLIPDGVKLYNDIKFNQKEKLGGLYSTSVVLGLEHGMTYAQATEDAFNLNSAVTGMIKEANLRGCGMVLRSVLGYVAAQRAANGKEGAYEDATKFLVSNMLRSLAKKIEISMLYGQMGLGVVDSISGSVITIKAAEFAPGIWIGGENMPLEIRDPSGALRGTCSVTAVDVVARTITVNAVPGSSAANDVIWHAGAYGNEMAGIQKIIMNTGSLFNIDAATYSLWKGNVHTISPAAAISLATVEKAIAKCVNKGLEGDVKVYVSTGAWNDLLTEQNAKRMYDQSYSSTEVKQGAKSIMFYGQNGAIEIVPSIYVKEGLAFVLQLDSWKKVGSTDITFKRPNGDEYFRELESQFGFELRAYADLAVFCAAPGQAAVITGIVNS
jgi:hypothetical protein